MRRLARDFRRQFAKRPCIVEHVNTSAMGSDHQIGGARMDLYIIHSDRRQIANSDPMSPLIKRSKQSEMSANIQQLRIDRIFADRLYRVVGREIARHVCPCLSAIGSARYHWAIVSGPVSARRYISDIYILRSRFDAYNPLPPERFGQIPC